MARKDQLVNGETYHVMSKSIEGYHIFPRPEDYQRFLMLLSYFQLQNPPTKFSFFLERHPEVINSGFEKTVEFLARDQGVTLDFIAFCLMPTHFHIVVRQHKTDGVSILMKHALNGYTRYFNTKYKRKGVLWMGRFKNVRVQNDEQLLHLTRYVHLNPVTAGIISKPEMWEYSSYSQYLKENSTSDLLKITKEPLGTAPEEYRRFVENNADYQRELAIIKKQILN